MLLIPQLLFGGALVAFAGMSAPVKAIADLMSSRWAFAGAGHAIAMNARLGDVPPALAGSFGTSFFSPSSAVPAAVLLGFTAAALLAAAVLLARRGRGG